ncbi:hypothetical protein A3B57_04010 [Microgenomates group bacterium RIFCSPLOWO2_01_FULL_47_10]|nr:MAG: hypothetical protein A3B57_04010 [Microgenomates group bacterium RIFCSPLOWO2_01_FULL_47_10]
MVSFNFHQTKIHLTELGDATMQDSKSYTGVLKRNKLAEPKIIYEMNQVHGKNVIDLKEDIVYPSKLPACDGLITDRRNTALMIKTADCLPIIMTSEAKPVIAALHAGWKGLSAGIHLGGISKLDSLWNLLPKQIFVYIGPSIQSCCYVFEDKPTQAGDVKWQPYISRKKDGWHIDLPGFAKAGLISAGVPAGHITDSGECTCHESNTYFSYVRHKNTQSPMGLCATVVQLR